APRREPARQERQARCRCEPHNRAGGSPLTGMPARFKADATRSVAMMLKNAKLQGLLVVALGGLLGYGVATGKGASLLGAGVAKTAPPSNGIQVTGDLGSPSATTTIDGKYLPNPPPKFGGTINLSARDSKPWWPPRVVPPKGAPNVLLIMTDDQGYGVSGTFGGVIPTPAIDRVAKMGLRYTPLHS